MKSDKKLYFHLSSLIIALFCATVWVILSFLAVKSGHQCADWFSRSGAILVVVAVLSSVATRPYVYDHTFPNLVNTYNHALGREELEREHWASRFNIFKILSYLELFLAISGTLIWSYGDIWL